MKVPEAPGPAATHPGEISAMRRLSRDNATGKRAETITKQFTLLSQL